jgi:hypothetical protein
MWFAALAVWWGVFKAAVGRKGGLCYFPHETIDQQLLACAQMFEMNTAMGIFQYRRFAAEYSLFDRSVT